jgi:preprotein translocase subunit SecG
MFRATIQYLVVVSLGLTMAYMVASHAADAIANSMNASAEEIRSASSY